MVSVNRRKRVKKMEEKNRRKLMTISDTKRRKEKNSKIETREKKNSLKNKDLIILLQSMTILAASRRLIQMNCLKKGVHQLLLRKNLGRRIFNSKKMSNISNL